MSDERSHLSCRPDDWESATDEEIITALGTRQGLVNPFFLAYCKRARPAAVCRYLALHEELGGHVGLPARRFLRKHGR